MAGKISDLTAITGLLAGTEEIELNQGGNSKKCTVADIRAYGNDGLVNASVSDQTVNATTALLAGSTINIPANKLRIGTVFKFRLTLSKTGAGTAACSLIFQLGTAGTTADADILTFSTPTATGVADDAEIEITVTIRGPLSGSCIAQGSMRLVHNLQTTGFATIPCVVVKATSGAFDATVANLIASLVCTTGASTVWTFQQVVAEAIYL